jgi:hypothetical protein
MSAFHERYLSHTLIKDIPSTEECNQMTQQLWKVKLIYVRGSCCISIYHVGIALEHRIEPPKYS